MGVYGLAHSLTFMLWANIKRITGKLFQACVSAKIKSVNETPNNDAPATDDVKTTTPLGLLPPTAPSHQPPVPLRTPHGGVW